MKIGIYGGSFNPIHNAHIEIVKFVLDKLKLDKIIIIPVGTASHRDDIVVEGKLRMKMCELAFENEKNISVSDIEINEHKVSYTIDTLYKIISLYGEENEFFEIIGEDSANYFSTWKEYKKILELSKVVVFRREGYTGDISHKNLIYLDTPLYDISSTMIRKKIHNNEDISKLVPEKVANFIKENSLY
ncbi:nicotinate (nicotinamide) nucleotide adenylyltransferase [Fusobacterium sp.]|uniref:nicotinate (nicotinamide) nucleotide adenylyltransferase n=1 Tax=Fusobacterium sp. TaxID=68766 RepID=UPI0025C1CA4E|nr:nicotinate (nicotinamide) nucleotide adenylyltransferase [Fusobacterium sp.]